MNEKSDSETIHFKLSNSEALILVQCMIAVSTFAMYIDDIVGSNTNFSMIGDLKNKISNAVMAKPNHKDSEQREAEILQFYEALMRRKR